MANLERRTGSLSAMADSMASFRAALDRPIIGVPRFVNKRTQIAGGDFVVGQTTASTNLYINISSDISPGETITVANDGTGVVFITFPGNGKMKFTDLSYTAVPNNGGLTQIVYLGADKFTKLIPNSHMVTRVVGSSDFTDGSGLTSDGAVNQVDLSSVVPEYATNGLVHVAVSVTGSASVPDDFIVNDGGYSSGIAAAPIKVRALVNGSVYFQQGIARMSGRSLSYQIDSTVATCGLTVLGWQHI